jgi:hypothetical protein
LIIIFFYLISLFVSPILYSRYVAFLSPLAYLFVFVGLIYLYKSAKYIFSSILLTYLILFANLVFVLITNINWTDYIILKSLKNVPIYTEEVLDIMPCTYYSSSCIFVGDLSQTINYVGAAQVSDSITTIPNWQIVNQNNISIIYRENLKAEILAVLSIQGYKKIQKVNLGDNVYFEQLHKL